jgi:hypothetical protein
MLTDEPLKEKENDIEFDNEMTENTETESEIDKSIDLVYKPEKKVREVNPNPLMPREEAVLLIGNQINNKIRMDLYKQYKNRNEFKQAYQRMRLLKELIQTERSYVIFLSKLITLYMKPLKIKDKKKMILEEKEYNDIFSNIEEINMTNANFLKDLEKELKNPNAYVGYVFKNHSQNFKICFFFF